MPNWSDIYLKKTKRHNLYPFLSNTNRKEMIDKKNIDKPAPGTKL